MSSTAVSVLRIYNNTSTAKKSETYHVSVPGDTPITPEHVPPNSFSSPLQSYDVQIEPGNNAKIFHPNSYSDRFHKQGTTLREEIEELKKKVRNLEDVRKEDDARKAVFLKWETPDRLCQSLNDYAFKHYLPEPTKMVIHLSKMSYLPLLLSVWAYSWYKSDPEEYPLPECLSHLSPKSHQYYTRASRKMDDTDLKAASDDAWYSIPEGFRNLMLHCYNLRYLGSRNDQAHPTPSIRSALEYFADPLIPLSPPLRTLASKLLVYATRKPHPDDDADEQASSNYVFDDTEGEHERKEEEEADERDIQWAQILNDSDNLEIGVDEEVPERAQIGEQCEVPPTKKNVSVEVRTAL